MRPSRPNPGCPQHEEQSSGCWGSSCGKRNSLAAGSFGSQQGASTTYSREANSLFPGCFMVLRRKTDSCPEASCRMCSADACKRREVALVSARASHVNWQLSRYARIFTSSEGRFIPHQQLYTTGQYERVTFGEAANIGRRSSSTCFLRRAFLAYLSSIIFYRASTPAS